MDDINASKAQFNLKVEEFISMFSKVQVDNNTTRSLVKKQYDEFATMYSHIEINKAEVERLERAIENLPVIAALEQTDEYLNKYLPFKVQKMIDDALF